MATNSCLIKTDRCPERIVWPNTISSHRRWLRHSGRLPGPCGCSIEGVTIVIIKPNRGRDWLDWQRKVCSAGKWVGLGALLLMMGALPFRRDGDPAVPAFCASTPNNWITVADLQRLNGELRADLDRVQYDSTRIEELARNGWGMCGGRDGLSDGMNGERNGLPVKTP